MNNINEIRNEFKRIVNDLDVHDSYKVFHDSPTHDGSPHVEKNGNDWFFIVTEKGSEFERVKSSDPNYILYLLIGCVTHNMATRYELQNRVPNIDGRRIWFEYDIKLLKNINPNWANWKRQEYDMALKLHPFSDHNSAQQGNAP